MKKQPIRLGVIGTGDFGARHVATAAALVDFELRALADPDAFVVNKLAAKYGVRSYLDAAAMLSAEHLDAVVIATPERAHLENLTMALEAGVDALVEKPVVVRPDEVGRLRELISRHDRIVVPAHVSRYLPGFDLLRSRVAAQQVLAVRAVRTVPRARLDLHGGEHPALVAMVHDLDLVRAIVSADLSVVTSVQRWSHPTRRHPQIVMATLRFADGTVASVENHWTLPHERQYIEARLEVTTVTEILRLSSPTSALKIVGADGDHRPDTDLDTWVAELPVGALATQLRHFADCVRSHRPSDVVTVEDAMWSVEVATRIAAQVPPRRSS